MVYCSIPQGCLPWTFFYKMWPHKLFDHITAETNCHYDWCATEGHNNQFGECHHFIDNSHQMGTHLHTIVFLALRYMWASQGPLHNNISTIMCRSNFVPFLSLSPSFRVTFWHLVSVVQDDCLPQLVQQPYLMIHRVENLTSWWFVNVHSLFSHNGMVFPMLIDTLRQFLDLLTNTEFPE